MKKTIVSSAILLLISFGVGYVVGHTVHAQKVYKVLQESLYDNMAGFEIEGINPEDVKVGSDYEALIHDKGMLSEISEIKYRLSL